MEELTFGHIAEPLFSFISSSFRLAVLAAPMQAGMQISKFFARTTLALKEDLTFIMTAVSMTPIDVMQ